MLCFRPHHQRTERTSSRAKKLIIQSCHLPSELWIMVSSPLNRAYLEIKGQMPNFRLTKHQTKEPDKEHPTSLLWSAGADYKIQSTKSKPGDNAAEEMFATRIRGGVMCGQEEKRRFTIKGVCLRRPPPH